MFFSSGRMHVHLGIFFNFGVVNAFLAEFAGLEEKLRKTFPWVEKQGASSQRKTADFLIL